MDACRVPYAGLAHEIRFFRVDSLGFCHFVAPFCVFLRDLTHKPLSLTNPYLNLTIQKHLEKKTPYQEAPMKTYTLILFFVFSLPVSTFAQWYEPAPCYACVPQSGSQSNPYTDQTQHGWAPNFGLGYNETSSSRPNSIQGQWQNEAEDRYYGWEDQPSANPSYTPPPIDDYSYGMPRYNKRLDSCGPYYNQRGVPGC